MQNKARKRQINAYIELWQQSIVISSELFIPRIATHEMINIANEKSRLYQLYAQHLYWVDKV